MDILRELRESMPRRIPSVCLPVQRSIHLQRQRGEGSPEDEEFVSSLKSGDVAYLLFPNNKKYAKHTSTSLTLEFPVSVLELKVTLPK